LLLQAAKSSTALASSHFDVVIIPLLNPELRCVKSPLLITRVTWRTRFAIFDANLFNLARYINNENIFQPLFVVFLRRPDIYFVCRIFPHRRAVPNVTAPPAARPRPHAGSDNVTAADQEVSLAISVFVIFACFQ
ncbi:TPA: hypothetical protein LSW83_005011, partial [Serratia marcescens]|nr:hypothetical protein [Serratia marcescens]